MDPRIQIRIRIHTKMSWIHKTAYREYLPLFSILCEMTLMLAWNEAEAGRILETYKLYENKPPDMIMEKTGTRVQDFSLCSKRDSRSLKTPLPKSPPFYDSIRTLSPCLSGIMCENGFNFECGSGSGFLSQCVSGSVFSIRSGSRRAKSRRIGIRNTVKFI
jgi:hypothetical protein